MHTLMGDLRFATNPGQPRPAVRPSTAEAVFVCATALAAVALLSWRYFLSDSQRRASR